MPTPILLLLTAAAYGASTALIVATLGHFPPWTLAALRAALALPVMLLLAGAAGRQKRPDRHDLITMLVGGTLVVTIPFVALAGGLGRLGSGTGGMLLATMPLFTLALAPLFQRDEPPHFDQGLRLGAGIFGVTLIAIPGLLALGFVPAGQAVLLTLLAPLSYAAGNVWFRRRRRIAPLFLSAAVLGVGAVTLWPLALLIEGPAAIAAPGAALPLLLGLVLVGTLAPLLLNFVLLERGAAREAGLALLIMPFFSLGFGLVFLGESLSLLGLLGLVLVIGGARWRVQGLRRARAALPAEVQGLMRSQEARAVAEPSNPADHAGGTAPSEPRVKLTSEERAARRAERRAERQTSAGHPDRAAASEVAGAGAGQSASQPETPGKTAERRAAAPALKAGEAPEGDAVKLSPEERAERRAARRAARQAAQAVDAPDNGPAGADEGVEAALPQGSGGSVGENPGSRAARKAARQAARRSERAALQDN